MKMVVLGLVGLVAVIHVWFMVLEMFLWRRPIGLKTFAMSAEKAETTAVLAGNQGLYNGFLAAGLIASLVFRTPEVATSFQVFFLACVVVAGVYGAMTANRKILVVQAMPAAVALACVLFL